MLTLLCNQWAEFLQDLSNTETDFVIYRKLWKFGDIDELGRVGNVQGEILLHSLASPGGLST
jgi:hypothetical protein